MQALTHRIPNFIWFLALVVLLPACFFSEDAHDKQPGRSDNVLRFDVDFDFGPFNPTCVDCSGSTYIFPFIYSFLCIPNPEGELEPDLAVAWDYDPKTLTWQIQLREDARFHNGKPVTAVDVVYSILSWSENSQKNLDRIIRRIKATDRYVLEIQLEQDDPSLLTSIWDLEIIPDLSRHENLDLSVSPVGSGPFKFHSRTDDGRVILVANENYYKGRPAIDEVVFYYIPRREKSWSRLIAGQTDVVENLTTKNYEVIRQYADRYYFSKYYYNYYSILLYNTHHPLFQNPVVRRALTHAIDRDYIIKNMLNGLANVIAGPVNNQSGYHHPKLQPLAYDPPLALQYLEKAGWSLAPNTQCQVKNGQIFEFDLLLPAGSETNLRVARFIKLNLNEVGIRVHLKVLPPEDLNNRYYQNTEFDAALIELCANDRRPEDVLALWVTPDAAISKAGGFYSPEVGLLARRALNAKDPAMKKVCFQRFDKKVADLQPGSFLFQKMSIDAISKRFTLNYPFSLDYPGLSRMKYARLKDER